MRVTQANAALRALTFDEEGKLEMSNTQATMTEAEFCKRANISRTLAWQLRKQGKLPHARIGSKILYTPEHLAQFIAAHEQPTGGEREQDAA
jgi:hypothetical protein